jgi:D-alanyl-D-alanine endopeptidase (penicillin-binding protein 7)
MGIYTQTQNFLRDIKKDNTAHDVMLVVFSVLCLFVFVLQYQIHITSRAQEEKNAKVTSQLDESLLTSISTPQKPAPVDGMVANDFKGGMFYPTKEVASPNPSVKASLVADLSTPQQIYFSSHADLVWPIASLTKLMTAVVTLDRMPINEAILVPSPMFSPGYVSSRGSQIEPGERFSRDDILHLMLLVSSNEAAEVLAGATGRSDFLLAMNKKAKEWGMADTVFEDPTGLSANNRSTVVDMQKMVSHIYREYGVIFEISRKPRYQMKELVSGADRGIMSINEFAGNANFLGGKTGFTEEAIGNLISLFSYRNRPLVIIVFGTPDRFGQTRHLFSWFINSFSATN